MALGKPIMRIVLKRFWLITVKVMLRKFLGDLLDKLFRKSLRIIISNL